MTTWCIWGTTQLQAPMELLVANTTAAEGGGGGGVCVEGFEGPVGILAAFDDASSAAGVRRDQPPPPPQLSLRGRNDSLTLFVSFLFPLFALALAFAVASVSASATHCRSCFVVPILDKNGDGYGDERRRANNPMHHARSAPNLGAGRARLQVSGLGVPFACLGILEKAMRLTRECPRCPDPGRGCGGTIAPV